MTIPKELEGVIACTPDTLHGAVRFVGTRVFATQLFDYLLHGETLETFLDDFEGVTREQAEALIKWELNRLHGEMQGGGLRILMADLAQKAESLNLGRQHIWRIIFDRPGLQGHAAFRGPLETRRHDGHGGHDEGGRLVVAAVPVVSPCFIR